MLVTAPVWYVCVVALLLSVYELVPYWRYRERAVFAVAEKAPAAQKERAVGVGQR